MPHSASKQYITEIEIFQNTLAGIPAIADKNKLILAFNFEHIRDAGQCFQNAFLLEMIALSSSGIGTLILTGKDNNSAIFFFLIALGFEIGSWVEFSTGSAKLRVVQLTF